MIVVGVPLVSVVVHLAIAVVAVQQEILVD